MFPIPSDLFPLFYCPLCPPSTFLTAPTTLRCGHTLCSSHISSFQCPIPSCSSQQQTFTPNIPASSRISYFPASPAPEHNILAQRSQRRVDVRINNIIHILIKAVKDAEVQPDVFVYTLRNSDDDSDSEECSQCEASSTCQPPQTVLPEPPSLRASPPSSSRLCNPHRQQPDTPSADHPPSPAIPRVSSYINSPEDFEKALTTELTCEICFTLLYQPATTPCQHTFCSKCLQRSLDHSMLCPLCREDLPGFVYFQDHPHNKIILSLLLKAYPDSYVSRGEAMEREERDSRLDTPIFVCQLSFPGMPTLLHFFEPRYRLMLRRCLERPSPTFGMIMPPRAAPMSGHGTNAGSEFGTMLEIKSVQMFPDGRSMVETRGAHRFRILERGSLDGYMIGRTERIDDYDDDLAEWAAENDDAAQVVSQLPSPQSLPTHIVSSVSAPAAPVSASSSLTSMSAHPSERFFSTSTLLETCHAFLKQLRAGTAPWVVQRFNYTYGPQPPDTDPGAFSFWMGMVLPIDEHEKAKLLPVKSARLRLRMVVGWIEQLNSNWPVFPLTLFHNKSNLTRFLGGSQAVALCYNPPSTSVASCM
ncbi:LON-domain-containing protein [Gyrodon lividus]|nr:LON-domain-containing protein [Gyrodon lividus]